jgi:hypothetical protein
MFSLMMGDECYAYRSLPVLHCVFYNAVETPAIADIDSLRGKVVNADSSAATGGFTDLKAKALELLKDVLKGDELAAEYVLVHLTSRM